MLSSDNKKKQGKNKLLCKYLMRTSNERIVRTPDVDHISDEMFLSVVCCEDGDFLCRVAKQSHVHVCGHHILSLSKILQHKTCQYLHCATQVVLYQGQR
jgi:hypothetical protein